MKDAGLFQQEEFDTRYKDKIRRAEGREDMGQGTEFIMSYTILVFRSSPGDIQCWDRAS